MMNTKAALFALTAVALMLTPPRALAVDGVVEINAAKVQAAGGYPYRITQSGSYRLTSELRVSDSSLSAIKVTAADVTIDLNGFSIIGPGSGSGIGIDAGDQHLITIRDGEVAGMGGGGIKTGHSSRIHHMRVFGNGTAVGDFGIWCTDGCIVSSNIVNNNHGSGIEVLIDDNSFIGGEARIIDNIVQHNANLGIVGGGVISGNVSNRNITGFHVTSDAVLTNNKARDNAIFGLLCSIGDVAYSNNVLNGPRNQVAEGSGQCIQTGSNICNGALCP